MIDIHKIRKEQLELTKRQSENIDNFTLVKFSIGDKSFAVEIKSVHEIIESIEITPYPEKVNNHIGIINVRGEIIPLVQIEKDCIYKKNEKFKIIILEFTLGKLYAVKTNKIQKLSFKSNFLISGQTINLNGIPAYYLDEVIFENFFKDVAC